jgi:hypothetical protein
MPFLSFGKSCLKSIGSVPSWNIPGRLAFAGLVGLASTGCQFTEEGASQVSGRVTYHDKSVNGGSVFLMPTAGFMGTWGTGVIGEDGRFVVRTTHEGIPLAPGLYGVSFSRPVRPQGVAASPGPDSVEIPEKYLDLDHPVFTIQVGTDRPLRVDITLRD